ncbi:hypothetical protein J2W42_002376 [Rhizobium tibeticum]|nr:hypothetical protein [Rhizobium tibeticum]MDP9809524.1 hypothetical protein [Rhizobium tibeticum]
MTQLAARPPPPSSAEQLAQRPNGRIVIVDPNAFTIVFIVTA